MDPSGQLNAGNGDCGNGNAQTQMAPSQLPSTSMQPAHTTQQPCTTSLVPQLNPSVGGPTPLLHSASQLELQHQQYPPMSLVIDVVRAAAAGRPNPATTLPIDHIAMATTAPTAIPVPPLVGMFPTTPQPQAHLQQQPPPPPPLPAPQRHLLPADSGEWQCFSDSRPCGEAAGTSAATTPLLLPKQQTPPPVTKQHSAPMPILVGSTFPTSKDLRVAVETSLMMNGRGLICKPGGSRQKKFGCAGCGYVVRAVKSKGTGQWKISSVENPDHPDCIGGRMRPSSKALLDVAGVFQADTLAPASALWAQLQEQGITVNVRQVSRAKAIAEKRQRGIESEPEGGSSRGSPGEPDPTSRLDVVGVKAGPKGGGSCRWPKRRRVEPSEVPNLSEQYDDQVVQKAIQGSVDLDRLEQALGEDHARAVRLRRKAVGQLSMGSAAQPAVSEVNTVSGLSGLPVDGMDYSRVYGKNCENVVGFVSLPVGVAGPLVVDGEEVWVPLATTQGGLVASVNRGCRAISVGSHGGARAELVDDCITTAPCVVMPTVHLALELKQWVERTSGPDAGFPALLDAFQLVAQHVRLSSTTAMLAGRYVYLCFKCATGDAIGMEMVNKGCEAAVRKIQRRFEQARLVTLTGNDKTPPRPNWTEGQGKSVVVEAVLSARTVASVLKTTVKQMVECNTTKNLVDSAMAGRVGRFNSNAANVVAAVFLATGQHLAHTVEGSKCITLMEEVRVGEETRSGSRHGDLRVSVTLPSLLVGTVGGGADLPGQAACLQLTGCRPATSASGDVAPAESTELPGPGTSKEATVEVENGGGGTVEEENRGSVSGSGGAAGGDSGDDRGQRTAISLVAEAAAAAAAAAEAEAAAEKLMLSSGAVGALGAVGSTPFPSENGMVTGETVVEGKGKGKETEASAGTRGIIAEADPAASKVKSSAPDAFPTRCLPKTGASRLACVIGAAVMAGELSLLAALASNDPASTHVAQNRKKQAVGGFSPGEARTSTAPTSVVAASNTSSTSDAGSAASRPQEGVGDAEITGGCVGSSSSSGGGENLWKMNSGALALDGVQQVEAHSGGVQSETQATHEPSSMQAEAAVADTEVT